jgi:hypothetical protein
MALRRNRGDRVSVARSAGEHIIKAAICTGRAGANMKLGYFLRRCVPHLMACTILLSCAAKPQPVEINVQVQPGYKGTLHVSPCSSQASAMPADERGRAYARECPQPGQEIELVVVQGGQTYRVPSEKLTISKTGDGIPVEISTVIE